MTITNANDLDTNYFQDGQAAGSITPSDVRVFVDSAFGLPPSPNENPATGITTSTYTAALTDRGTVVEMNSASAQTFSIPTNASVAFDIGTIIEVYQMGAGQVTVAAVTPGTTTLRSATATFTTRTQYAFVTVRKRAADEWVVSGDLA